MPEFKPNTPRTTETAPLAPSLDAQNPVGGFCAPGKNPGESRLLLVATDPGGEPGQGRRVPKLMAANKRAGRLNRLAAPRVKQQPHACHRRKPNGRRLGNGLVFNLDVVEPQVHGRVAADAEGDFVVDEPGWRG